MNPEELESLGFTDNAWLDEEINAGGERRSQIEHSDFEIIKALLEGGGKEAVTEYLNATWNAWYGAECLIRAVDSLFNISGYGRRCETYDYLVDKVSKAFIGNMTLALVNATTEIPYDDDPNSLAEDFMNSFAYGLAHELEKAI